MYYHYNMVVDLSCIRRELLQNSDLRDSDSDSTTRNTNVSSMKLFPTAPQSWIPNLCANYRNLVTKSITDTSIITENKYLFCV